MPCAKIKFLQLQLYREYCNPWWFSQRVMRPFAEMLTPKFYHCDV